MKVFAVILFAVLCSSPVLSHEKGSDERPKLTPSRISISGKDNDNFLKDYLEKDFLKDNPWAQKMAPPFIYEQDNDKDGKDAFIVSGTNSSERLKKITQISGISISQLQKRMFAWRELDFSEAELSKADYRASWKGANNVEMRRSGEGFLASGQDLRKLLIRDNDYVLSKRLTHQKVADPLLKAMEAVEKAYKDENVSINLLSDRRNKAVKFEYGGKTYSITPWKMGGQYHLSKLNEKDPRDAFKAGWIGYGTQGSPFNDELFANWGMTIEDSDGTKLSIDALTPFLIHRYGFYQGGPYRVTPNNITTFFGLVKK